ncbi:MAG: DNA recombination protein RmuC [Burkholderiales bacterium]|nr:DNA recombination protein RmuC [Burkholderiales bacterium]
MPFDPPTLALSIVALLIGATVGWWMASARSRADVATLDERVSGVSQALALERSQHQALREQAEVWRRELDEGSNQLARWQERVDSLGAQLASAQAALAQAQARLDALTEAQATTQADLADTRARLDSERLSAEQRLQELQGARDALSLQFKALANEILEDKSRRFAEQNQASLSQLLDPLRQQLGEFKGKVEEVYVQEGKDRSALAEQVRQLAALNQSLSQDAKDLTRALKGQTKTQGNWGELVLERVLEASGLRKGHEYKVQDSQTRDDGSRAQPDVVIELPEGRSLVIDAKVSLLAYERFVNAADDDARAAAQRMHLESVRKHIRELSEKRYQQLYGLQSLDFVLAFVPVEPAFMLAVTSDNELFMDAWQRNVLLVSPSTLLFVVRTVAHLWRQEAQSRNAQEIARRGAELYDKLCGFVGDLERVGERLKQARDAFDGAQAKLHAGRGNVIRQAEMLRELGVKPTKQLPEGLVQLSQEPDESPTP